MANKNFNFIQPSDTDNLEGDGFIDGDFKCGNTIATFSFINGEDMPPVEKPTPLTSVIRFTQRGFTPPIDGEAFTLKRCYRFRESTFRKLNEMKSKHPEVNVYLNTIIDEAVNYYYDNFFTQKS